MFILYLDYCTKFIHGHIYYVILWLSIHIWIYILCYTLAVHSYMDIYIILYSSCPFIHGHIYYVILWQSIYINSPIQMQMHIGDFKYFNPEIFLKVWDSGIYSLKIIYFLISNIEVCQTYCTIILIYQLS